MKLKTLEDVLLDIREDIRKIGIPLCSGIFTLFVWADSVDCKPIIGTINIQFNKSIASVRILIIFDKIDVVTPISTIIFRNKIYHVTKTEEFMKKSCKECS